MRHFVLEITGVLWYNLPVNLEKEDQMPQVDYRSLERHLVQYAIDRCGGDAMRHDPTTEHHFLDTCFIEGDEIDLTAVAEALAKAINVRVD